MACLLEESATRIERLTAIAEEWARMLASMVPSAAGGTVEELQKMLAEYRLALESIAYDELSAIGSRRRAIEALGAVGKDRSQGRQ